MDEKKVREAIEFLQIQIYKLEEQKDWDEYGQPLYNETLDEAISYYQMAIKTLGVQLPTKVNEINDAYTPKIGEFRVAKCPNCGHEVSDRFDVCLDCGQNLDWSVKNE